MLENELTLVISSCDKFSDLWEAHLSYLQKNWGDRNIRTILLTDKPTDFTDKTTEVFCSGEGLEYAQRMKALLPLIDTEYLLITLDDYFPIKPVFNERIERLVSVMEEEKLDYIRMFKDPDSHKRFKDYEGLYAIDLTEDYAVNLYQGIWRKSFLSETLTDDSLPIWQYEVSLSRIALRLNAGCVLSKGNEFEILDVIRKGRLLHKSRRVLKKDGIVFENRKMIPYWFEIKYAVFDFWRKLLPRSWAKGAKRVLRRFGVKFISDYGSDEA